MSFTVLACSEPDSFVAPPSEEPEDPVTEGVSETSPLYLKLGVQWEQETGFKFFDSCALDATDSIGTTKNCTITIPERKLYFSDLTFMMGTKNAAVCPVVIFSPYYYLRSSNAAYTAPGEATTTDCSVSSKPTACYGGAAPALIGADFPSKVVGYYTLANVQ